MQYVAPIVLVGLMILFVLLIWKSPQSTDKFREALFRNTGMPYRNLIGLLLGSVAAVLLLTTKVLSPFAATLTFVAILALTLVLLIAVRPYAEHEVDRFAWGLLAIITLGFGLGTLVYQYRDWWKWIWHQYLRIKYPHELILESLFLLGVILGFFVVRNWAKEQKAFQDSLAGALGGTFIATILGKLEEGPGGLSPIKAFAYYALGFTMSGTLNLFVAAYLTANYTNKRSITSRAILDFLYGSERAEIIDKYFLKNFKDDPDYAKASLVAALLNYRELVSREFAERMEERRLDRKIDRRKYEQDKRATIPEMRRQKGSLEPACPNLQAAQEDRNQLQDAIDAMESLPPPRPPKEEAKLTKMREDLAALDQNLANLMTKCSPEQLKQWQDLEQDLNGLKPSYYYELMAIELDDESADTNNGKPTGGRAEQDYSVMYRIIDAADVEGNELCKNANQAPPVGAITKNMFRVGISARWQDTLEYITAPGEYRMPFKYTGSVAGLAFLFRKTIVMDRDKRKKFRNAEFPDGITPGKVEQPRGLDEIDFLSYVSIPIVSHLGEPGENPIGIVTVDTKLFVTRSQLGGEPVQGSEGVFRIRLQKWELTEFGTNLYDQEDKCVDYIERLTRVITPVLELYSKCRIGAT